MSSDIKADVAAIEGMASLLDRVARGDRVDRCGLLQILQVCTQSPTDAANLTVQNASLLIEALADQTSWLSRKATLSQCRWFATELHEIAANERLRVAEATMGSEQTSL